MSRTSRSPFLGSLSIHAVVLLVLVAVRDGGDTQQAADTAPRTSARLVFMPTQGDGGGKTGGGGDERPEPARRVEAKGIDRMSVPVAPAPTMSPEPQTAPLDVAAPVLDVVPMAAATELVKGLIDPQAPLLGSQGPGTGDGAGTGTRGGNGPEVGTGPGSGSHNGIGGPYESGNGVSAPVPVRQARPQYTTAAMSARLSGSVLVECVVMPDGTVDHVRVVRSLDPRLGLDEEAVKAARQWRFRPGTRHGEPVPVRVTIELSFSIY